jgi:hypothetical protein
MLAHLMDMGADGAVPNATAKKMVLQEAGGDVARAQQAWTVVGLPGTGPVSVDQLEQARAGSEVVGDRRMKDAAPRLTCPDADNSKKRGAVPALG